MFGQQEREEKIIQKLKTTPREATGSRFTGSVQGLTVPHFPPTLVREGGPAALPGQLTSLGLLAMCVAGALPGQTRLSGVRLPLALSSPVHGLED